MRALHPIRRLFPAHLAREYAIRLRLLRASLSPRARAAEARADVLLISYPKCGRTWLTLLLARALAAHSGLREREVDYLATDMLGGEVAGMPRLRISHDDNPHWKTPRGLERSKRRYRDKKVVLLVRDPRDVVVSMYFERTRRERAYSGTLSEFLRARRGSLDTILGYYNVWARAAAEPRGLCLVRYEDLQTDTAGELERVLRFAGLASVVPAFLEDAVRFGSFESMRELESSDALGSGRLRARDPSDVESYKTRRGKVGGYVDYLTLPEIAWMEQRIRAELDPLFGYGAPARAERVSLTWTRHPSGVLARPAPGLGALS